MTREKAKKLGIDMSHIKKLERNVEDALKVVSREMVKAPEGQFNSNQIMVYILSVMYMLMNTDSEKDISYDDMRIDFDSSNESIYNKYKDYMHYKKDYHKSKEAGHKEMMLEYRSEMIRSFKELLNMVEDKFRAEMSSSDCEELRDMMKHRLKALANEFNL